MRHITFFVAAVLALAPQVSYAQSLVDVSKTEEARRQSVKKPAKIYTNSDLKPDFTTPTASATPVDPADPADPADPDATEATSTPGAGAADAGAGATPAPGEQRDRAYWNGRMTTARAALDRSRMFAEALQTSVNSLTTDAINRDDPAQRSALEQDRVKALAELDRVTKEITDQTQAIAAIEDEARRAGVPPGWLR